MFESLKQGLKRYELFGLISWLRNRYAQERVDYRRLFKACGTGVDIDPGARISNCHMISVGDNVLIQEGVLINGQGGLVIGSNVGISFNTTIWTIEHNYVNASAIPFDEHDVMRPVRINDNVWIGANVNITSGVEIGEGAVIGMGAVVISDVRPLAIVLGNPARAIGFRDGEHYERCKAERRFVDFRKHGNAIVPMYIQKRPRLFEIVRGAVGSGRALLEKEERDGSIDAG
jgi:acetyltransferase-like isoleucine patch superfamily enzyme